MSLGILGKKIGMTHFFDKDGRFIPVTAIQAGPCPILQIRKEKNIKKIKIAYEEIGEKHLKKPILGIFKKLNLKPHRLIREISVEEKEDLEVGKELKVDIFQEGEFVDVTGTCIGKGFQGGMKRWGWHGGPASHGSMTHRRVGSIGASSNPSRVFKGQHMPGHMGAKKVTVQNLKVIKVDATENLLLLKGAVPGYKEGYLFIRKTKKKTVYD